MKKLFYPFVIFSLVLGKDLFASSQDNTLFESDAVVYDKNTGKFTTVGEVKIDYKNNKLITSEMEFDTNTNEIKANNNVDITNSDAVMDTQNIVINTKDDTASLGEMNVKFGKNSYAKAKKAIMKNPKKLVLKDVEYTACKEGLNECSNPPTWKIGA